MSNAKKKRGSQSSRSVPIRFGSKSGPTALVSASELKIMENAGRMHGLRTKTGKRVVSTKELRHEVGPRAMRSHKITNLLISLREQGITNKQLIDSGLLTKEGVIGIHRIDYKISGQTRRVVPKWARTLNALKEHTGTIRVLETRRLGKTGKRLRGLVELAQESGIPPNEIKASIHEMLNQNVITHEELVHMNRPKPPAKETAPKTMTPELSRLVIRINSITKRGRQGKQAGSALVLTPEEAQIIKTINTKYNITLQEIGTKEAWNALTEAAVLEERIRLKRIRVDTQQVLFDQEMGARIEEAVRRRIANNRAEISGYLEQLSGGGYGASVTSKVREAVIRKRVEGMVRDYLNIIITKHKLILTEEERLDLETKMSKQNYKDIKKRLNL